MKKILILAALGICSCTHMQPVKPAPIPSLTGAVNQTIEIRRGLAVARDNSKEVRRLQTQSLTLLDQLDQKIVKLLEK